LNFFCFPQTLFFQYTWKYLYIETKCKFCFKSFYFLVLLRNFTCKLPAYFCYIIISFLYVYFIVFLFICYILDSDPTSAKTPSDFDQTLVSPEFTPSSAKSSWTNLSWGAIGIIVLVTTVLGCVLCCVLGCTTKAFSCLPHCKLM
jgi:hypothetical protein